MFSESAEGADAVRRQMAESDAFDEVLSSVRTLDPRLVLTCARGSSDHAATYAKYLFETLLRVVVSSASPSISSIYGSAPAAPGALCLAISQSGGSPDLLATVESVRRGGATALALVNAAGSPLAASADMELPLLAGPELSVAATKSYIVALAAVARLASALAGDRALLMALEALPDELDHAWAADWSPLTETLRHARGLYVIGRGYGLGIAQEAALKFKECCQLHAEAFSAAEVRHGPAALIGPDMPLLVFRQRDDTEAGIDALMDEALARGAVVLVAGDAPRGATGLPTRQVHAAVAPIVQIQSFYRAVEALSRARGLNPDRPAHLSKVTQTV
jgi:glucosamine--fructose-6-phosphate aminotransferase (isomerizing)